MDPGVDPNTGLIYLRARYYDPSTAQFLTVDPLVAQTQQSYTYAGDDPINATDPSGLCGSTASWGSFWANCGRDAVRVGNSVAKVAATAGGSLAAVAGVVTTGCVIATAASFLGEVICAVPGTVAVAAGAVGTVVDGYLTLTGQQSGGSFALDLIGTAFEFGGLRSGLSGQAGVLTTTAGVFSFLYGQSESELEGTAQAATLVCSP